jgi:hypothetical protein
LQEVYACGYTQNKKEKSMSKKLTRKSVRDQAQQKQEEYYIEELDHIQRKHEQERHNLKEQAQDLAYPKKDKK